MALELKMTMKMLINSIRQLAMVNFAVAQLPNVDMDYEAMTDSTMESMNFDTNCELSAVMHHNHFERRYRNYIICKREKFKSLVFK
jgi:hypothetical protein